MKKYSLAVIGAFLVLGAFLLVYRPTLFDFLTCGDLYFMTWAYKAMSHPQMLMEQYRGPFPHGDMMFYRPNLYAAIFLGYKCWHLNGLYFRLVNMLLDLLSAVMLCLVIFTLGRSSLIHSSFWNHHKLLIWSLLSGVLFILYPSHSESINWVTVIANPLTNLFFLAALWCYIQWRTKSRKVFFILSIISSVLAFLTKETAVALPPTILIYEVMFLKGGARNLNDAESSHSKLQILFRCLEKTIFYWLILVFYFVLRKILLGDFIAAYPDSVNYQSITGWLLGLRGVFVPINILRIGAHSVIFKIWHVCLFIVLILTIVAVAKSDKNAKNVFYFLVLWFFLALAPNYKIFPTFLSIDDNGRLAYLATAPLCALLTYGIAAFNTSKRIRLAVNSFALVFFTLAATILYNNNLVWAEAGNWSNKLVREVKSYYQNVKGDPLVYIAGVPPVNPKCVLLYGAVTQKPIMDINRNNCLSLEALPYIGTGFIKQAAENNYKPMTLLYWDSQSDELRPILVPKRNWAFSRRWYGNSLRQIIGVSSLPGSPQPTTNWLSDGTLEIISNEKKNGFVILDFRVSKLPCWYVDFLGVKMQFIPCKEIAPLNAELCFTNNLVKVYSKSAPVFFTPIKTSDKQQQILFSLRNMSVWGLGGNCSGLKIALPIEHSIKIKEVFIPETKEMIPAVNFAIITGDHPGQLRLGSNIHSQYITYDARSINGASQIVLEVIQVATVNKGFVDSHNVRRLYLSTRHIPNCHGQIVLNKTDFPPEPAIYKASLRALDKTGNRIGYFSDDFFIRTD